MFLMINISKVSPLNIYLPFQKCYACHPIENTLQIYSASPSLTANQPLKHIMICLNHQTPPTQPTNHSTSQLKHIKPLQVISPNPPCQCGQVMLVSAPTPVNIEPPAPPVMQRRISGRDAKIVEGHGPFLVQGFLLLVSREG